MAKQSNSSSPASYCNWRLIRKNLFLILVIFLLIYLIESLGSARHLLDYGKKTRVVKTVIDNSLDIQINELNENHRVINELAALSPKARPDEKRHKRIETDAEKVQFYKQYDEYCDSLDEWVQLTEKVYFRRSFAFYFVDKGIYRTFFVAASADFQIKLVFLLDIEILDESRSKVVRVIKHNVTDVVINQPWFVNEYGLVNLDAWFDLKEILKNNNLNIESTKLTVNLRIHDLVSNRTTQKPIEIKVKYYNVPDTSKKPSMLCTKCYYLDHGDLKHMHWWFELNKKFGYDKLVICNNSIESPRFNELVKKYEGFVDVTQMKCLPNFLGPTLGYQRKYLRHYTEIKHDGEYVALMSDVFSGLAINECLLNYTDQYNYINVDDYDDTIIPRKYKYRQLSEVINHISSLTSSVIDSPALKDEIINDECHFDNYDNNVGKTELEYYLRDLVVRHNFKEPTSFYFGQGFYMKHGMMDKIFSQLGSYIRSPEFVKNKALGKDHIVAVIDLDPAIENVHWPYNYTFVIKNTTEEINYIQNLIQIHQKVIKPFLKEKQDLIETYCDRYDRLYMISGYVNNFAWGKTIHNTKTTYEITLHHSYRSLWQANRPYQATYASVPYDSGHLAHFRNMIRLQDGVIIPINQLHLDLNFLNCYFRPIIDQIRL